MSGATSTVNRRAGIATLSIDGVAYDVAGSAGYAANRVKRDTLAGQSGIQGYKEMPIAPYISATIRDAGSLTVESLNRMTNVALVLTLANGKLVSGEGLWSTEVEEVETEEATFKVRFEGVAIYEQTT